MLVHHFPQNSYRVFSIVGGGGSFIYLALRSVDLMWIRQRQADVKPFCFSFVEHLTAVKCFWGVFCHFMFSALNE